MRTDVLRAAPATSPSVCIYALCITIDVGLFFRKESDMIFQHLSNLELLAILVGQKAAQRLYKQGLSALMAKESELAQYPEIGAAREIVSRALLEELKCRQYLGNPASVRDYIRLSLFNREYEVFVVIFLDNQNRVIEVEELFRGTLSQTSVYPREVVKRALHHNAGAVIFAHNHPSGVAEPSRADELLTRGLKDALSLVDVKVADHFIVAGNEALSFAERGLL